MNKAQKAQKKDMNVLAEHIANLIRDLGDARQTLKENVNDIKTDLNSIKVSGDYLAGQVSVFSMVFRFIESRVSRVEFDHEREKILSERHR